MDDLFRELIASTGEIGKGNTIVISTSTLEVQGDTHAAIEATMSNTQMVVRHEEVHKDDGHLKPLQVYAGAEPNSSEAAGTDTVLVMGGQTFDDEELHEAVTVIATGTRAEGGLEVSDEYKDHKAKLEAAIAATKDMTYERVRRAVAERNVGTIDDRAANQPEQVPLRMAA